MLQVLLQALSRVGLGDDGKTTLGGPSKEDLSGGLAVLLRDRSDDGVLEERRGILGLVPVEFDERLRSEAKIA